MAFLRGVPAPARKHDNQSPRNLWLRTPAGRRPWRTLVAVLIDRFRKRLDPNAGVVVRARLTYAIGPATIAMGDDITAFRGLKARPLTPPGLCVEVSNFGEERVTIVEVGLTRGEDGPQIAQREPYLHDNGPWPRVLEPGEAVVAHFGSGLAGHPVLPQAKHAYALTPEGRMLLGPAGALADYLTRTEWRLKVAASK